MKKEITLELKMSELIYDIQNKTYLTGRSLDSGAPSAHIANMQANDDEENAAQVLRSITMAFAVLRNRLSEFMESSDATSSNICASDNEDLSLTLRMPSNFNSSATKALGQAAHQFIVATAVTDWFAITAKGETTDYTAAANSALSTLEEILNRRSRPSRP